MRAEAKVIERIKYWKGILEGILEGEDTKKTIGHIIRELEWVLEKQRRLY